MLGEFRENVDAWLVVEFEISQIAAARFGLEDLEVQHCSRRKGPRPVNWRVVR